MLRDRQNRLAVLISEGNACAILTSGSRFSRGPKLNLKSSSGFGRAPKVVNHVWTEPDLNLMHPIQSCHHTIGGVCWAWNHVFSDYVMHPYASNSTCQHYLFSLSPPFVTLPRSPLCPFTCIASRSLVSPNRTLSDHMAH